MADDLTLTVTLRPAALDARRGIVRLHPEVMAALAINPGDPVRLAGRPDHRRHRRAGRAGREPGPALRRRPDPRQPRHARRRPGHRDADPGGRGPPGDADRAGRDRRGGLAGDAAAGAARQGGHRGRRRLAAAAGRAAGRRPTARWSRPPGAAWPTGSATPGPARCSRWSTVEARRTPRWSPWTPWSAGRTGSSPTVRRPARPRHAPTRRLRPPPTRTSPPPSLDDLPGLRAQAKELHRTARPRLPPPRGAGPAGHHGLARRAGHRPGRLRQVRPGPGGRRRRRRAGAAGLGAGAGRADQRRRRHPAARGWPGTSASAAARRCC